jgi:hypothetical protein
MLTETERLDVEKVIHDAIGWALTKDIDRLFSIMAQDDDFFIFHPDSKSTIIGFEAFNATDFAVKDFTPQIRRDGKRCLVLPCMLDDHAEWNGQPIGWMTAAGQARSKSARRPRVIAQMHFSFPKDT